jgi:hypothetical protein
MPSVFEGMTGIAVMAASHYIFHYYQFFWCFAASKKHHPASIQSTLYLLENAVKFGEF